MIIEMENNVRSLNSSIEVPIVEDAVEEEVQTSKLDEFGRARATGRRKRSSARVWIATGDSVTVNGRKFEEYFPQDSLRRFILEPLAVVGMDKMKIITTVKGGGLVGQAGAIRHGISLALVNFDPTFRPALRTGNYVTRDNRKKERKTPGFRTARKPQQWNAR